MAKPAPGRETASSQTASHRAMVGPKFAAQFWAAVVDCLVEFHRLSPDAAQQKVADLKERLASLAAPATVGNDGRESQLSYEDMIYHAEPWDIACNLANNPIRVGPHSTAYDRILQQNHLA